MRMTVVAVTGVSSAVGRAVVACLDADPEVERIVGIDRQAPPMPPAKLEFVRADLRDPALARVLGGVDVLVHQGSPDEVGAANPQSSAMITHGTRHVLEAVRAARVGTVVYVSTALVYGARETNRVPLTEDVPPRAGPEYPVAHQALVTEESVRAFAASHLDRRVVILRPVPVLGTGVDSSVTRHMESPVLPMVRGFDPPVQFVDVDDLAAAVRAVTNDARASGVYNVAAEGWLTTSDVRHLLGRPTLHLPHEVAAALASVLHDRGLLTSPPGALDYLMHPWVVDTSRLHALGWTPASGHRDILHRFVADHGPWLSVGRLRVRTARLLAAMVGVATAVGLAVSRLTWWRWLSPRWRRRAAGASPPTRRTPDRSTSRGSS
jgi:nucleoside-diphosphate-sugar epimerase